MINTEAIICLTFCPAFFTCICLWTAIHHLFELGKSKSRIRKIKNSIPFFRRIMLVGYVEKCEYNISTAKRLYYLSLGYVFAMLVCIVLLIISTIDPQVFKVFSIFVYVKVFVLDIPVNIYGLVMTRPDKKRGGVTWVWTDKN